VYFFSEETRDLNGCQGQNRRKLTEKCSVKPQLNVSVAGMFVEDYCVDGR
jgi:hypothetical protein